MRAKSPTRIGAAIGMTVDETGGKRRRGWKKAALWALAGAAGMAFLAWLGFLTWLAWQVLVFLRALLV